MIVALVFITLLIVFIFWNKSKIPPKVNYPVLPEITKERYYLQESELLEILKIPLATDDNNPFYIIVDLESTGKIKKKDAHYLYDNEKFPEIVQIGWILLNEKFELVEENEILVKQEKSIPKNATLIHGITKRMTLINGVEINEALSIIKDKISSCQTFVSHNNEFDYDVLLSSFHRYNVDVFSNNPSLYDTMIESINLCQLDRYDDDFGYKYATLSELFKRCFFPEVKYLNNFSIKHNALADAKITAACFIKMKTKFKL
jgi:DNA polymerase III epsilon subunit-like protein